MDTQLSATYPTSHVCIPGPLQAASEASYWETVERAASSGASTIQADEPCLAGSLDSLEAERARSVFALLRATVGHGRILLTANPGAISRECMPLVVRLPVDAIYLDVLARPKLLVEALAIAPARLELVVPNLDTDILPSSSAIPTAVHVRRPPL